MKTQKDNRIELYRFIFAVIIMIFHAHNINLGQGHPIPLGHVFVEFFFFLTGYFTYASMVKNSDFNVDMSAFPFQYTWKKFKRFIPYSLMTATLYIVVSGIGNYCVKHLAIRDTILEFSGLPFDVLFLQVTGICRNPNYNAWWYLSAILFTMPLVILLFYKKIRVGGIYTYVIYFIPLLIYGAFAVEINGLDWDREVFGVLKSGVFRGFSGLCMGCIIYDAKNKLSLIKTNRLQQGLLTGIEIVSYILSVIIAWRWSQLENSTFLIVLLLIVGLIISFSNKSYTLVLNKEIFSYLGMISLPLYMCHYSIGRLIGRYYLNDDIFKRYLLYFICSFIFSISMIVINRKLRKE